MVNSEELTGTTEYLALYAKCRIGCYRYNRACLYLLLLASCENKIRGRTYHKKIKYILWKHIS
jgi:hypothetical protein